MSEKVAFKDAARVGVHDEHGVFASVEEDGVGGFRADATQGQELFAKSGGRSGEKTIKRAAMVFVQEGHEVFEGFGFLAVVTGGTEMSGKPDRRDFLDGGRGEQPGTAQVGDGTFDVFPGRVLREDSAYDNFEAGAARPPVLRAMGGEERVEQHGDASSRSGERRVASGGKGRGQRALGNGPGDGWQQADKFRQRRRCGHPKGHDSGHKRASQERREDGLP